MRKYKFKREELRGVHTRNRHKRTMDAGSDAVWDKIKAFKNRMREEQDRRMAEDIEAEVNDMMIEEFGNY